MAMSEREDRRRRMRAAAQRRTSEDAPASGSTAVRSKPVRITVDLTPTQYRHLKTWTLQAAAEVGASVSLADVVRLLAGYLHEDQELAQRVTADLQQRSGSPL